MVAKIKQESYVGRVQKEHRVVVPVCSNFTAVVGAQIHGGDTLLFTISRDPTAETDTYPDDVALIVIGAWYEVDTLGFRSIGIK